MTTAGYTPGWSTQSEMRFIDGLGRHTPEDADRRTLIQQYLDTMPKRDSWGSINPTTIEIYARNVMARLA